MNSNYTKDSKDIDMIDEKKPETLYELVVETYKDHEKNPDQNYGDNLLNILKKYHMWPCMQVKKFKGKNNIVLIHNTYTRNDIESFKDLYNQCRSVVLDFGLNTYNNVVVSYANSIPERIPITIDDYKKTFLQENEKYYEAYDGTMINVYNYQGTWNFGTSSCPDVNSSKFSHPTKRHGNMLDEILFSFYRNNFTEEEILHENPDVISQKIRKMFTDNLNPEMAYEFLIVHHENIHILDYTPIYGNNYMKLFHMNTKRRDNLEEQDINNSVIPEFINLGVCYPRQFSNIEESYEYMNNVNTYCYGIIVKKIVNNQIKLYKISTQQIHFREDTDPCNPNIWINMLTIYMKNRADYHINDYINLYHPNIVLPFDNYGKPLDPTYLIHTTISTIKDSLLNLYSNTTKYFPKYKRFRMNKELDKQYPPIIQYHLAQLRNKQVTIYSDKILNSANVYHYLCQCNNVKNIKTLIQFFASNSINEMSPRTAMCFTVLNSLLS